jgi:thiosulfate/3-mercaptopyruvate sulfurtransferase
VPMLRPAGELRHELEASGVDLQAPLVASCGSGLSACVLALSAYVNGKRDVAVYDVCITRPRRMC